MPTSDNGLFNIYRFFNTATGAHFFTASETEKNNILATNPALRFEGNAFDSNATEGSAGAVPVHRLYNKVTGVHLYTTNEDEKATALATGSYNDEGIAYYAYADGNGTDKLPLYRFLNTATGTHFYTDNEGEKSDLIANNPAFNFEGIAYYIGGPLASNNQAPSVAVSQAFASIAEDANAAARTKVGDIVVTDDAVGTNTLSLTGADAALFEIVGMELFLKAGAVLDFETNPALDVNVVVDDATVGDTPDDSAALSVSVTNVNEAPSVALTSPLASIAEDASTAARTKVADIVVTDDALGTNTVSLTGADAAFFEIIGTGLYLKAGVSLDFATNPSLDVSVHVDDAIVGTIPDDTVNLSVTINEVVMGNGVLSILTPGGNGHSSNPSLSANGTTVVFESDAENLTFGDTNGATDIFIYDVLTGTVVNLTKSGNGDSHAPSVSGDGGIVVFESWANNLTFDANNVYPDIFLYNMGSGTITNLTPTGNQYSGDASVSADGSSVVFLSHAFNLSPDDTNGNRDVFVYDVLSSSLINITTIGNGIVWSPSVSANGNIVVFESTADNLTSDPSNNNHDIFVYNKTTATFTNITANSNNFSEKPVVSADGSTVVFDSFASNLTLNDTNNSKDIFVYDVASDKLRNITSAGNSDSWSPSVSADGGKISFQSRASNLTPNDIEGRYDIFVYDVATNVFTNLTSSGNRDSLEPSISADGDKIVFQSSAYNLSTEDTNSNILDIFLYDFI